MRKLQSSERTHPTQYPTRQETKDLLEYVIVHEMAHLIAPTHSDRFIEIPEEHYPSWREARAELNELPLTAEVWRNEHDRIERHKA